MYEQRKTRLRARRYPANDRLGEILDLASSLLLFVAERIVLFLANARHVGSILAACAVAIALYGFPYLTRGALIPADELLALVICTSLLTLIMLSACSPRRDETAIRPIYIENVMNFENIKEDEPERKW